MPDAFDSVPRLGFGTANLGNLHRELDDDDAWAILDAAWNAGIRCFDTAPHYGLGLAERRLGAFLQSKPRDEFVVSTKVGRLLRENPDHLGGLDTDNDFFVPDVLRREWSFTADGIRASLDESLDRLGLDRVDLLYLHDPERHDLDLAIDEALPALQRLRSEGRVDAVGVGSMTSAALARCVREAQLDLIMIAGRYTLLEQPAAEHVLPACRERGTGVVAASVFNTGLLATAQPIRSARYEYGEVPDALWHRLQRILSVCRNHDVPLPAAAVQFPLRDPVVRSVVVAGSRPEQVRENAELAALPIAEPFWSDLIDEDLIPRSDGT
ncbi:MAG: aldo/keto reductase [Microcella sp.]|uniref:aldo/keto reductase n=1 Tax=Microcella sp. TaxID=1913979 RepID=UPI0024C7CA0A|nr:aldo/keto reductase [Microcella sp.]UYN84477.1 MAG: aldo/keto reductase [Microcella sp.]